MYMHEYMGVCYRMSMYLYMYIFSMCLCVCIMFIYLYVQHFLLIFFSYLFNIKVQTWYSIYRSASLFLVLSL